jgi:tetratricopeptide (TPR) repeat protein
MLKRNPPLTVRLFVGALLLAGCVWMINSAATFGFARMIARYSVAQNSLEAANEAVKLRPSDSEAHRARAMVLDTQNLKSEALKEIELAASLRPRDDSLWLEVGNLRDANSDSNGALDAFTNAVSLAPYYGHPRWQRGGLLVRMGRYDEGFNDLRAAAARNPNFVRQLIDLAWGISRQDPGLTEQLVRPQDDRTRLALTKFLATHGKGAEALEQFHKISSEVPQEVRSDLIQSLIEMKAFAGAFELWKNAAGTTRGVSPIENGGFEQDLILDEVSFGWQPLRNNKVNFALDVNDPQEGSRSLRITFDGYDNPSAVLSQIVLLKPQQTYRVSFAVKTRELVSGGLPILQIIDAVTGRILAESERFQPNANSWNAISFEFTTQTANAIYLRLGRNQCSTSPCPIFGQVWLDSFVIQER